jgi:hypothetical protein
VIDPNWALGDLAPQAERAPADGPHLMLPETTALDLL